MVSQSISVKKLHLRWDSNPQPPDTHVPALNHQLVEVRRAIHCATEADEDLNTFSLSIDVISCEQYIYSSSILYIHSITSF